ncbi:MAG: hypothetical protein PHX18_01405 [Candidatus Gastranaerophilales bacterium]|nr:hypothetical protein [Candidatus Gastranaerophilales bacterium]
MENKTVRVCHFAKLKIRCNGDIYPCCAVPADQKLGNIFNENIFEKIENTDVICECEMFKSVARNADDRPNLNYIHFETSNVCQASCVCCPQKKEKLPNEEAHMQKIKEFIEHYKPRNVIAIGGEILVQKNSMEMLFAFKSKYPDMQFHTITNLSVSELIVKQAEQIFDKMTVSMLGFQPVTYNFEMGLDLDITMRNFNCLYENKKVRLSPKYLAMPTNLPELPLFFDWAVKLDVEKIYLHNIHEFKRVAQTADKYWVTTFAKLEKAMKKVFQENSDLIRGKNRHFISIHPLLAEFIKIDEQFIKENGFEKIVCIAK